MDDPGRGGLGGGRPPLNDDRDDGPTHTNATSSSVVDHPDAGGGALGGVGWRGALQLAQDLKQQLAAARTALAAREAEAEAWRAREQERGAQEVCLCLGGWV